MSTLRRTSVQLFLAAVVAVGSLLGWRAVAVAGPADPGPGRGMWRMHELMESGNPGMAQMHERMMRNPGARRAHESMMQRGGMADGRPMMGNGGS